MNRREGEKKTDQMATNQNPLSIITEVPNKLRYAYSYGIFKKRSR
jgi:hypothetical protein